ncbi:hypothetical protein, partial [Desulfovibrio inopinatus]|uniref:hypothetical protein n=1 Tax=Desulfovibrio inopinatus TaxID=102109 RepID=UPI0005501807
MGIWNEVANGIGAFSKTYGAMSDALDKRETAKYRKDANERDTQRFQWETDKHDREAQELAEMDEYSGVVGGFFDNNMEPLKNAANKRKMFGEGKQVVGFGSIPGKDENTPEKYFFNIADVDGNVSQHDLGSHDDVGRLLMSFAPSSYKAKWALSMGDKMAEETGKMMFDPKHRAQLEEQAARLEYLRPQLQADLKGRQTANAHNALNLSKAQDTYDASVSSVKSGAARQALETEFAQKTLPYRVSAQRSASELASSTLPDRQRLTKAQADAVEARVQDAKNDSALSQALMKKLSKDQNSPAQTAPSHKKSDTSSSSKSQGIAPGTVKRASDGKTYRMGQDGKWQ